MKLKMNKEQVEKMIRKYYREELDFDGEVNLGTTIEYDMRDHYFVAEAKAIGNMELCGETFEIEKTIDKDEINDVIKFYFEKEGYRVGFINHQVNEDYHGDTAEYAGTVIEITQKVKTKGGIKNGN